MALPTIDTVTEASGRAVAWLGVHARSLLSLAAHHTGVPAVILAAVALVVGLRVLRKVSSFLIELGVAVLLLVALSEFGVITW